MRITPVKISINLAVVVLGISSLITQVILLREFLAVFEGNELIMGVILANWMLLTGIGSYLGKWARKLRGSFNLLITYLVFMAVLPLATVWLLNTLRNVVFPFGMMVSIMEILPASLILLLPYCLLTGFVFTFLVDRAKRFLNENLAGKLYALEAIGSLSGGILFNAVLIFWLDTAQSLIVVLAIDLLAAVIIGFQNHQKIAGWFLSIAGTSVIILLILFEPGVAMKKSLYRNQEIIYQEDTPYGKLLISKTGKQKNFYENGVLLFSTGNPAISEEAVHYAMIQREEPQNVLLISGGISGATNELLKYKSIEHIDYVELNPWIIKLGKKYTEALDSEKLSVITKDARLYLKKTGKRYDVILVNLPEPSTAQINRFYTQEFFNLAAKRLTNKGILSLSLPSTGNYMSKQARRLNSIIHKTLQQEFPNIAIVPGGKNFFLASNDSLSLSIARRIEEKGIKNQYVNRFYIDDQLLKQRSRHIEKELIKDAPVNSDFKPLAYFEQIQLWLSQFNKNYHLLLLAGLVIFILLLLLLNPVNVGLFTGGFAGASMEFVLLIAFQVIYGYVYQMIGVIITLFMAGLALGSMGLPKLFKQVSIKRYALVQLITGAYVMILPLVMLALRNANTNIIFVHFIFGFLTLLMATLVGYQFFQASSLPLKKHTTVLAAENYSADSIGSAIGALFIAMFLLPLIGIIQSGLFTGVLCWAGAGIILLRQRG
ncbi:MAG: fused MFS/spermidine synthase [Bacteroidales bacterium]|nr:fused MFS/spermidine synthase [Bacteroidales bacterium]